MIENKYQLLNERYSRQMMLPDFGEEGQLKLSNAKVLLVGVGGLGSPIALYLCGAGIGQLGLVDADIVSESNLQRQVLYTTEEIGCLKVDCAKKRLNALNPLVRIDTYPVRFTKENAESIASQYDIIIDGSDNFATRYLMDEISFKLNIPYIYGSIGEFHGQVSIFNLDKNSRYKDLFPQQTINDSQVVKGVLGAVPGIVGTWQAMEAVKIITGLGEPLNKKLLTVDLLNLNINIIDI
jgi:adenylyltransferase/sulfurtransferase